MARGEPEETTWTVVDEELLEVLSQGDDEPPGRWWRAAVLVAAAAALVGWMVSAERGERADEAATPAAASSPVALPVPETVAVAPSVNQLAGVWLVDEGPRAFRPGEMWMSFRTDGSFSLDANGALLSEEPWVTGRYRLDGRTLRLVVEGGVGCEAGDAFVWSVGLLPGGRLKTRHESDNGGYCRVVPGVWEARPLEDTDMWRVSWRP